jgi:ADP-heptose:LPS heptosyltransferase
MKRILAIKLDHIGDVLWAFPAVRALAESYPDARIDLLCTPYTLPAGERMPGIADAVTYDARWPLRKKLQTVMKLRRQRYDLAIVLGPVDKVNYLAYASGAKKRLGYRFEGRPLSSIANLLFMSKTLRHPADVAQKNGNSVPHEVKVLCRLAEQAGARVPAAPLMEFSISPEEHRAVGETLVDMGIADKPLIGVQLCAKAYRYGWSKDAFVEMLRGFTSVLPGCIFVLIAGPLEEKSLVEYTVKLKGCNVITVSGLPLGRLAALLTRLKLLVSWDTGVVHLASAVGTPIIDVFPSKDSEYCINRWGPWQGSNTIIVQQGNMLDKSTSESIIRALFTKLKGNSLA